jgi:hypothetical protein
MVKHLPSKCEAPNSDSSTAETEREKLILGGLRDKEFTRHQLQKTGLEVCLKQKSTCFVSVKP